VTVRVLLPGGLADLAGGARSVAVDAAAGTTLAELLAGLAASYPLLGHRLCDETGQLRRFVNVYVDGLDVRGEQGLRTAVGDGATVQVLPSIAGG
jgi:molybdopterin synthase sulfur carrier subunit